jgi:hypothetical protein
MEHFKLACFNILFAGFIVGIGDRLLSADLNSAGFSIILFTVFIPLCPYIK